MATTENNNGYQEKSISETIVNGFFTVDDQWTVKYWNKAAEKILGVSANDIIGKNLWNRFVGVLPLEFYFVYDKAFSQDIPVHFEEYWAEMGAWFDVTIYYCNNALSISFKSNKQSLNPEYPKNSEQVLKITNELYKFVTEVTNDCLWEWNFHTNELFWIDGGHKRVFGYQVENALIPQSFWESRVHPDDKERLLAKLHKVITGEPRLIWEEEYRLKKANGDYAYVHDRGHIIYDKNNHPIRMIGATQDITTRKLAEIKLLESERELSFISMQTVNPIIITDTTGTITWVNSAFTRFTEYESENVLGRKLGSIVLGENPDSSTAQYVHQSIQNKQPFEYNTSNYTKSGRKYWIHVQGQPLLDENGNFKRYLAIETEITEEVLLESRIAKQTLIKQKEITYEVLTAQEDERAIIAQELHDNLNQILSATKMYIKMAIRSETNSGIYLEKSSALIMDVIESIRKISKKLVTSDFHILGLYEHISILMRDLATVSPIKIKFNGSGTIEASLNDKLQVDIFKIVQDQLNSILKHKDVTRTTIELTNKGNEVILLISDNRKSCDVLKERESIAFLIIKSRAEFYHGNATIALKSGRGALLKVALQVSE